jgi:hypothetical protein
VQFPHLSATHRPPQNERLKVFIVVTLHPLDSHLIVGLGEQLVGLGEQPPQNEKAETMLLTVAPIVLTPSRLFPWRFVMFQGR